MHTGSLVIITLPLMLTTLAEGHAAAGEIDEAFACVAERLRRIESTGEVRFLAELHRLEGELLLAGNERRTAEARLRRAIELAQHRLIVPTAHAGTRAGRSATALPPLGPQPAMALFGRRDVSGCQLGDHA